MAELVGSLGLLFGGGAAAGGAAVGGAVTGGAAAVGGAAAGGINLAAILQGTATVLGVVSSISAGNAEAAQAEASAQDAETEQALETLQGIDRRTQTRKALIQAVGAQDLAYAASGVDLSVGTAAQARTEAFREGDTAMATSNNTELTRVSRLSERAANYRAIAKNAKRGGLINGLVGGAKGFASLADLY